MRSRWLALGMAGLLLLAGCASKPAPKQTSPAPATVKPRGAGGLTEIREFAALAHSNRKPPDERLQGANAAWEALVSFLADPASRAISLDKWEEPLAGGTAYLRVQESPSIRLYAISLPVPGGEPPFERVAVQHLSAEGKLHVTELKALPGGRLLTHHLYVEKSAPVGLVALWEYPSRGGGFVGHYQYEKGEFKQVTGAFSGLPKDAGPTSLEVKDGFLVVFQPGQDRWHGATVDPNFPLRFYVHPDWYVDFKDGKYTVGDDRAPGMYAAFAQALDKNEKRDRRQAAWLKASRKLPLFLGEMEGWQENLTGKLPKESAILQDQFGNISLRVVSIPTPEFIGGTFTVAQFRVSNGLPTAQTVYIPGMPVTAKLFANNGWAGILILSTRADGFAVTLLKMDSDGLWDKAPEWYGWIPASFGGWQANRQDHHLFLSPPAGGVIQVSGSPPLLQGCVGANCVPLDFSAGYKLSATSWLAGELGRLGQSGTPVTMAELSSVTTLVQQYLLSPDTKALTGPAFENAFSVPGKVSAFAAGPLRIVGMPFNATGVTPLIVQWENGTAVEMPLPSAVQLWVAARVIDEKHVAIVGRTTDRAAMVIFRKTEKGWENGVAAIQPVAMQPLGFRVDAPSSMVKGLMVAGPPTMTVSVTSDSKTYQFCETPNAGCIRFVWEKEQLVGPR